MTVNATAIDDELVGSADAATPHDDYPIGQLDVVAVDRRNSHHSRHRHRCYRSHADSDTRHRIDIDPRCSTDTVEPFD